MYMYNCITHMHIHSLDRDTSRRFDKDERTNISRCLCRLLSVVEDKKHVPSFSCESDCGIPFVLREAENLLRRPTSHLRRAMAEHLGT